MFSTSSNDKDGLWEVMAEVLATAKVKYVLLNGPRKFSEFKKLLEYLADQTMDRGGGRGVLFCQEVQSTWN